MVHIKTNLMLVGIVGLIFFQFTFNQSEFSYHGSTGPEHWCAVEESYAACCKGLAQSPVHIQTSEVKKQALKTLVFQHKTTSLQVVHNGHTIQANIQDDSHQLVIDGQAYTLLQFHFHTPSEHYVDEKEYPVEIHLVHKSADGVLAVVGILIQAGETNAELEKIWQSLPQPGSEPVSIQGFEIKNLLPQNLKSYRYSGSLTTPPCTESVRWHVLATPITLSAEQIDEMINLFTGDEFPDGNRRPVQPLNGRVIVTEMD